jgi:hypothetical protein
MRNGASPHTATPIILGEKTDLTLAANMFYDVTPAAFHTLSEPARAALARDNWFSARAVPSAAPTRRRGARPGQAPPGLAGQR